MSPISKPIIGGLGGGAISASATVIAASKLPETGASPLFRTALFVVALLVAWAIGYGLMRLLSKNAKKA